MATLKSYPGLMELMRNRYSCRSYDATRAVDPALVKAVVQGAQLAPSAVNRQPWHFIAVTDPDVRARILAKSRPAFMDAPVVLVCCGLHDLAWHRPADGKDHTDIDVAIAVEHICLTAASLGVGTCWVCSFDVDATRQALALPPEVEPVALIPLGYPTPGDNAPEKTRKTLDEILTWEKF